MDSDDAFSQRLLRFASIPQTVERIVGSSIQSLLEEDKLCRAPQGSPLDALFAADPTLGVPSTRAITNRSNHFKPLAAKALAPPFLHRALAVFGAAKSTLPKYLESQQLQDLKK
jgi:hypothetical protein